jgi:G3E family GTPase
MVTRPIPVYLLTGYLGSGKTSLLNRWLQEPVWAQAAVVINEFGQVGFDQQVISGAVQSAELLGGACVCCEGLPALSELLADVFWARLHRQVPRFEQLIIETTGVADPHPVLEALRTDPLLSQRYRLGGVITTLNASLGLDLLTSSREAQAQVQAAHVVVLTKMDRVADHAQSALRQHLGQLNPQAAIATSHHANFSAQQLLALLPSAVSVHPPFVYASPVQGLPHAHSVFIPMQQALAAPRLLAWLALGLAQFGNDILRIKGHVHVVDWGYSTLQWSLGDSQPELSPPSRLPSRSDAPPAGLTFITRAPLSASCQAWLAQWAMANDLHRH